MILFFIFFSLLVECRNLTGFTFTNFFFFFCGQGRLWLSFLTAIYLIHGTTFIMYAFLWEKKHVTNCLYILAPCKVFFLFFLYKKFNSLTLPVINHYFTDKLWKCDPGIHHAKYLLQQEKNIFFKWFFFFLSNIWTLFKTARKGSGKITEGVGKYQKNQLKHKNCTKMLRSMITGEKKNLSTMLQFKSWKKKVRDFLPHVSKCHPIFLKQG